MAYDAFISYSHAADGELAPRLQSSLHRFAKPWWKMRAVRVFRDETSLAAASDLTQSIIKALGEARYFILLASPAAARSKWVEREVAVWLASKPPQHILIVLTEGTIVWDGSDDFDWSRTDALPRALARAFVAEPLWVDLTWARTVDQLSSRDPRFHQATARLAAPLHGRSLDEIAGEDVLHYRKTQRIVRGTVATMALLAAAAVVGAWSAHQGRRRAEQNLEQAMVAVEAIETAVAKDLQDLTGVPIALRMKMLTGAERVLANLANRGEGATVRGTRAVMLSEFASAYGVLGNYADATARVAEAIAILEELLKSDPEDVAAKAALAKSRKVYGDVLWWERKDLAAALKELRGSAELYAALVAAHPSRPEVDEWKLFEYRALIGVGDVLYDGFSHPGAACAGTSDCLLQAKAYFTRALNIASAEQNQDGADFHWRNGVLVSRERLAKVDVGLDDRARAGAVYADLLQAYEGMAEAQPDNSKWQENMMALFWRVGGLEEKNCQLDRALRDYTKALEIARKLHRAEPSRIDWSHELSLSLEHTARAHEALGQNAAAEAEYRTSLSIYRELIGRQPNNEELKDELGSVEAALARHSAARSGCHPTASR